MKKLILLVLLLLCGIAGTIAYISFKRHKTSSGQTEITIGIATWPGFASGIVGQEKGFFQKQGISLNNHVLDDAPARHAAFQSGSIDIMVSSLDVFAQEAAQGIHGKAFLITDQSYGGDGIVAKANIKGVRDLKGKKVAFARGTPSHYFLYQVLERNGLSPKDIQAIPVDDPSNAGQALISGAADAAVTFEPFLSTIEHKAKGNIIATTRDYPGIIVDVLVASDKMSQDPNLLKRFIAGWMQSVLYIRRHENESATIMAKQLNIKPEDAKGMMAGLRFADQQQNVAYFNDADPEKTQAAQFMKRAAEFWKAQGVISHEPDTNEVISNVPYVYFHNVSEPTAATQ